MFHYFFSPWNICLFQQQVPFSDFFFFLFLCVLEVFRRNWTHRTQCKTPPWSGARRRRRRCTWAGRTTCTQTCPWRDPLAWWPDRKKRDWRTVTKYSIFFSVLVSGGKKKKKNPSEFFFQVTLMLCWKLWFSDRRRQKQSGLRRRSRHLAGSVVRHQHPLWHHKIL